ncbi:hypothetical protein C8R43DRAFT_945198 [Mycena crocata]|nr:hypothetical protein C8R43DRAFT_945198 [Mycena crocata]
MTSSECRPPRKVSSAFEGVSTNPDLGTCFEVLPYSLQPRLNQGGAGVTPPGALKCPLKCWLTKLYSGSGFLNAASKRPEAAKFTTYFATHVMDPRVPSVYVVAIYAGGQLTCAGGFLSPPSQRSCDPPTFVRSFASRFNPRASIPLKIKRTSTVNAKDDVERPAKTGRPASTPSKPRSKRKAVSDGDEEKPFKKVKITAEKQPIAKGGRKLRSRTAV